MRTTPFGDIVFDDVEVPTSALLGREGAGATIFSAALNAERGFIFIAQVGAMEWQLDETIDYAQHRKQGGVPIFEHQTVSHRIVDMKLRHETARLLMYKTALAELRGDAVTMDAALSKLMASEHAVSSAFDAVVNHGAVGFLPEFEVERTFRDFVGGVIYSGTSDIQRNIVARLLASDRRRRRATSRRATTS